MNIIDAVKSGKPFRRANAEFWKFPDCTYLYGTEDLSANDWEIQGVPDNKKRVWKWAYYDKRHGWKEYPIFSDVCPDSPESEWMRLEYSMIEVDECDGTGEN